MKSISRGPHCLIFLFLFFVPAFGFPPEVSLLVQRNESLTKGFTEFRLQLRNNTSQRLYIEHFPSMASCHIFIVGETGTTYPNPAFSPPSQIGLFSRRFTCLFPSAEQGFLLSVAKNSARKISGPGVFYLVFATRKPFNKTGILISAPTQFDLNSRNEIVSYLPLETIRLPIKIKDSFRTEIETTMKKEGLLLDKSDNPF